MLVRVRVILRVRSAQRRPSGAALTRDLAGWLLSPVPVHPQIAVIALGLTWQHHKLLGHALPYLSFDNFYRAISHVCRLPRDETINLSVHAQNPT